MKSMLVGWIVILLFLSPIILSWIVDGSNGFNFMVWVYIILISGGMLIFVISVFTWLIGETIRDIFG